MGTKIVLNPLLSEPIHLYDWPCAPPAAKIFADAQLLIIDGVPWRSNLKVIQAGLNRRSRGFKHPFGDENTSPQVLAELNVMRDQTEELVAHLYPEYGRIKHRGSSFRPMVTGPEPLHYDTYDPVLTLLTTFINVAIPPRVYKIGYSFPSLARDFPNAVREVIAECNGDLPVLSYKIRGRTQAGLPPLGDPKHHIEFATGSIWFFNPKTVSHEVVYGAGAMSFSWKVTGAAKTQLEIISEML